jgi:hypothetical protein
MEFEDCDNIQLPVDSEVLVDQLIEFRDNLSGETVDQQVVNLEQIIDSISDNPTWSLTAPSNLNVKVSIDKNVIKKIPIAVAAGILTPKNLLPLYTLLSVVQSGATYTYNQAVTEINETTTSITEFGNEGANIGTQGSNIVNSGEDFLKIYKTFAIQVISQINAEFLQVLYEILKKDIVNLVSSIISDIQRSAVLKNYAIILRLAQIALVVSQLVNDYRKCKSLLDNILLLLNLIGQTVPIQIPLPLLSLAALLPGTSPERASINVIEGLQKVGIPTGTLPDGSPNLMGLYDLISKRGSDKEEAENGKILVATATGPGYGKKL